MEGGLYIYAIAAAGAQTVVDAAGIDGNDGPVVTLLRGDIAAVVSRCDTDRYAVTRDNVIAHRRVMEAAMKRWPILPVRFNTVAKGREQIAEKLLTARREEFRDLFDVMTGKVEFGLRALWPDMSRIFTEIAEENPEIKMARTREPAGTADTARLGRAVTNALDRKRDRQARLILRCFDGLWFDRKVTDSLGASMILNASFLIEGQRAGEFDRRVENLADQMNGRVRLRYVGPVPPCDFVEVAAAW